MARVITGVSRAARRWRWIGGRDAGDGGGAARGGARRGALRRRQPRALRDGRLELPPDPHRRRAAPRCRRCGRGGRRLSPLRRAGALARWGHEPRRTGVQRRRRPRLLEIYEPRPRDRPGAAHRPCAAGRRARRPARRRRSLRPHLRPRPLDAQPLHAGRDAGQQRLRRPLRDGGQDRREHRGA